jgi:pectate lyase
VCVTKVVCETIWIDIAVKSNGLFVEVQNVEVQNVEVQNVEVQNVEVQNVEVQNVEIQIVDIKLKTSIDSPTPSLTYSTLT